MFKKTLICLAVASTVGLTGCPTEGDTGNNDNPEYRINNPDFSGRTWPIFNPVTSELPLPNDLIFRSDDLSTVGVSEADGTFDVTDIKPPVTTAINKLSGASTVAPIDIAINGTIDASSVDGQPFVVDESGDLQLNQGVPIPNPNQNVFLIELAYASGEPLQALSLSEPPTIPLAQPFVAIGAGDTSPKTIGAANALARDAVDQYEVSVVEQSGKSVIRFNLLKPLDPKKRYLAVVTNGVKDSGGDPIIASPTYANLTDKDAPLGSGNLEPVKSIINGFWEAVASSYFALPNNSRGAQDISPLSDENIAISYSFLTSDDEEILPYMAQPADWFTGQLQSLVRLGAVRKIAGAATVLSAAASDDSTLEEALKAKRTSDDEVGPNDTNRNGKIDPLDFDFNGDDNLTAADFNLSSTGDTEASSFNFFDVQAGIAAAEMAFPSAALQAALPQLFGSGGACAGLDFGAATSCAGTALATLNAANLPQIGDKSDSIELPPFTDSSTSVAGLLTPALSSVTGSDTALVLQGSIKLPYYLGIPSGDDDGSVINSSFWTADHVLAAGLNDAFGAVGLQLPQGATSPETGDFASDAVNYLYPFPAKTEDLKVPMLVMVPRPGTETASGFTWDGASQLPVVVFQHGITTDRSAALSVGSILTAAGYGVVAIDLPLHGIDAQDSSPETNGVTQEKQALSSRLLEGFDASSGDSVPEQDTADNTAALIDGSYVSGVVSFVGTQLGCSAAPADIAAGNGSCEPGTNGLAAQFVGFAIGAQNSVGNYTSTIPGLARTDFERHFDFTANASGEPTPMNFDAGVGSSGSLYINLSNFFNSRDKNLQSQIDLVNLIASVGNIDVNGDANGDFDTSKIFVAGHSLGTVAAAGAVAVANQTDIDDVQATTLYTPASGITRLLENSPSFAPRIVGGLAAQGVEQGTTEYETFMRFVQNALDPADPINLADDIVAGEKGIMTFNVVGTEDGNGNTLYPSDQTNVIEAAKTQLNEAFPDYLAGGIPLSEELGATNVVATDGSQMSLVSNLAYGAHSMYVLPSSDSQREKDAFSESLLQTVEFFMAGGALTSPVDPTNGRLGVSDDNPEITPILDDRPTPSPQDVIDADDTDEFTQLNPLE